jgi:cation diffusion facilitator CzcD-associated flavoprotein CzcO
MIDVIIVGAGFAGLGMGIRLTQEGRRSFVILEKDDGVGGTWRANTYPGCACDVPSHLYSFSFAPNPRWSRHFAPQSEILAYLEDCADRFGLRPHLRPGTTVTSAEFDEASGAWRVSVDGGPTLTCRHLVLGVGALSRPAYPEVPGLERFGGKVFHSARWDAGYDLGGKSVAVVGTGASAIQFVPQIAPKVKRLSLYQRTAPWVLPRPDRAVSLAEQLLFAAVPATQRLYRSLIFGQMELRALGFTVEPRLMKLLAQLGRRHIRRHIADPVLRKKLTPEFLPGCKRVLMSDDYYPALARPNVDVITDRITGVTADGLISGEGRVDPVDAIILGTGFRVTDVLSPLEVRGRGGVSLNALWQDSMEAHLGATVAGFPNFYMLVGPNTGLGHNSMVFMIEAQVHHVVQCLAEMEARGAVSAEVRPAAQRRFNEGLQRRLGRTVWASGCKSWYLDARGRNTTLWPGFTLEFWWRTRRLIADDYRFQLAAARPEPGPPPHRLPRPAQEPARSRSQEVHA